jgi:uncharacterized coiled-coil DUF342 family protein
MNRVTTTLAFLTVATLGIWGCAQGPTGAKADAERIKALEAKNARLEDDYRAVTASRDQLRKKLAASEQQQVQLRAEIEHLQSVAQERDQLQQQVKLRTNERDSVQVQFEEFRKGIRSLLGQAEAAVSQPNSQPVTSAAVTASPGKM